MQRVTVTIADEQHASLKSILTKLGVPVSLQVRRAITSYLAGAGSENAQAAAAANELLAEAENATR